MPDSIYKDAPHLFGADSLPDYYNLPVERASSSKSTVSSISGRQSKETTNTKKPSQTSAKKHNNKTGELSAKTSSNVKLPAQKAASLTPPKSGPNMEQVISSLSLVVEAMKQQTMAMQMISQMAPNKAPSLVDANQLDTKAFLESFGEVIGNFRSARAVKSTLEQQPDSPKVSKTIEQQQTVAEQVKDEKTTTSTTTTSTSTTTTQAPSTSSSTTSARSVVTNEPPTSTSTTTSKSTTTSDAHESNSARYLMLPSYADHDWLMSMYRSSNEQQPFTTSPLLVNSHPLVDHYRSVAMPAYQSNSQMMQPSHPFMGSLLQHQLELQQKRLQLLKPPTESAISADNFNQASKSAHESSSSAKMMNLQWIPVSNQQTQNNNNNDISDEVPKIPGSFESKPEKQQQTVKIGERPSFEQSNFQLLSPADAGRSARSKVAEIDQQQQPIAANKDLNGNESIHQPDWVKQQQQQQQSSHEEATGELLAPVKHQPGSYSILGGRLKITPHTQVIHYLLEPFQVALGQLMAVGQSAAAAASALTSSEQSIGHHSGAARVVAVSSKQQHSTSSKHSKRPAANSVKPAQKAKAGPSQASAQHAKRYQSSSVGLKKTSSGGRS